MALNLKPLGDRVVVEPIEQEEITAGGIVLIAGVLLFFFGPRR